MRLSCINVPTPDTRRFAEFYQNVLGAAVDESKGGPGRLEITFGGENGKTVVIVALQDTEYKRAETTTCQGFEFEVSDARREYERILSLGVEIKEPPKDLPWGYRYFHIKDPDGNGIDIVSKL